MLHHDCIVEIRVDKARYFCELEDLAMALIDMTGKKLGLYHRKNKEVLTLPFTKAADAHTLVETLGNVLWNNKQDVLVRYSMDTRADMVLVMSAIDAVMLNTSIMILNGTARSLPGLYLLLTNSTCCLSTATDTDWTARVYTQMLEAMGLRKEKGWHHFCVGRETLKHLTQDIKKRPAPGPTPVPAPSPAAAKPNTSKVPKRE